jgi:hypothetical protein
MTIKATIQFPQLGGEGERYQVNDAKTKKPKFLESGAPATEIRFPDMPSFTDPASHRAAVANLVHAYEGARGTSAAESGRLWYPKVNEAVAKGIGGGRSAFLRGHENRHLAGSGLVAAVSPNMDWERNNIDAFGELKSLKSHHWDTIMAAPTHKNRSKADERKVGEAQDIVRGMSIGSTSIANLQKAGRIIRGEHVDTVLDPRTAPKTYNFAHNIHDPHDRAYATIDGRAFDTLTNRLRPWTAGRGISSSHLKRGTSRYEHAVDIFQGVGSGFGVPASEIQAVAWEHTKQNLERLRGARSVGPLRLGQPYFHPETGAPALHDLSGHHHLLSAQFSAHT